MNFKANNEIRCTEQSVQTTQDAQHPGPVSAGKVSEAAKPARICPHTEVQRARGGPGILSAEPGAPVPPVLQLPAVPCALGRWRWHSRAPGQAGLLGGNKNTKAIADAWGVETR